MWRYRSEAEYRERICPVEFQDWSSFQAWWDSSCRHSQDYLLTPEETEILKRQEPSTERRITTAPQSMLATSADVEGALAAGSSALKSDAELNALFEDDGE